MLSSPVYRARTAVLLEVPPDPYAAVAVQSASFDGGPVAPSESYVQNELKVLQSDSLAERVADSIDVQTTQAGKGLPPSSPLEKFLTYINRHNQTLSPHEARLQAVHRALTIRSSLKSQVVEIYFDSSDPARAAIGANTVVSEYMALNREAQMKAAQDTTEWLSSQVSDLKAKLDAENQDLKTFATATGLIYSANQSALAEQRVSEIQAELTKAEADRAAMRSRYQTALSSAPESIPDGDSALLHEYETNLVAAERDLSHLRTTYTDENYKVTDAEARVAQIQASIQQERRNILQRIRAQYESASRLKSSIESTYRVQTQQLQSQSADVFRYNTLKHELDTTQKLYDSLLQKIEEAEIASSLQTANVRLIDRAHIPSQPFSPNRTLNAVAGASIGLLAGILVVLIRYRDTLSTALPAEAHPLTIREIGAIPDASNGTVLSGRLCNSLALKRSKPQLAMTVWHSDSPLMESYSSVVASILFTPGFDRRHKTLAITSVRPQEGKTTVITNIAIMLAETYGRILLIDGDLRRPTLHRIFGEPNDSGFTTLLSSEEPIETIDIGRFVLATTVPRLFLLPSGPGVPSIAPLLHSPKLVQVLDRAREEFDCVLIDTPPISLFSDARLLGRLVDSVVLVIDADKSTRNAISDVYRQLIEDGTTVLGAIRNRTTSGHSRYSYENYKSYGSA
jgi:capsular exopolysaccharide synthesis family protein